MVGTIFFRCFKTVAWATVYVFSAIDLLHNNKSTSIPVGTPYPQGGPPRGRPEPSTRTAIPRFWVKAKQLALTGNLVNPPGFTLRVSPAFAERQK